MTRRSPGRRSVLGFLLVGGLLLLLPFPRIAGAGLSFECEPDSCKVMVGDSLDVYIVVADTVSDLQGASLGIRFDPSIFQVVSFSAGSPPVASCFSPFFPPFVGVIGDSIFIDTAGLGCSVDGPLRLVCIRFVAISVGTSPVHVPGELIASCPLTWESIILRDSMNQDIPCEGTDGEIFAFELEGTPSRPVTWGSLKQGEVLERNE